MSSAPTAEIRQPPLDVRSVRLDCADAQALIAVLNGELVERYPEPGANHFDLAETEVAPGQGVFLIGYSGGAAAACGALRKLDAATAEIKRMFVLAPMRGRGYSRAILRQLEAMARSLGVTRLVLETAIRQPEAIGLYRSCGFFEIPRYGEYIDSPLSLCFAKDLVA